MLAVEQQQSADAELDSHGDPHAAQAERGDEKHRETEADDPDAAKVQKAWHKRIACSAEAPAATMEAPKNGSASSSMRSTSAANERTCGSGVRMLKTNGQKIIIRPPVMAIRTAPMAMQIFP